MAADDGLCTSAADDGGSISSKFFNEKCKKYLKVSKKSFKSSRIGSVKCSKAKFERPNIRKVSIKPSRLIMTTANSVNFSSSTLSSSLSSTSSLPPSSTSSPSLSSSSLMVAAPSISSSTGSNLQINNLNKNSTVLSTGILGGHLQTSSSLSTKLLQPSQTFKISSIFDKSSGGGIGCMQTAQKSNNLVNNSIGSALNRCVNSASGLINKNSVESAATTAITTKSNNVILGNDKKSIFLGGGLLTPTATATAQSTTPSTSTLSQQQQHEINQKLLIKPNSVVLMKNISVSKNHCGGLKNVLSAMDLEIIDKAKTAKSVVVATAAVASKTGKVAAPSSAKGGVNGKRDEHLKLSSSSSALKAASTHPPTANVQKQKYQQQQQQQEKNQDTEDISRSNKKKRCSDRYDSSESSDSGLATLSCTDSSTASSDASDPGSPYSPGSVGGPDDINHLHLKANMPPLSAQQSSAQQQKQLMQLQINSKQQQQQLKLSQQKSLTTQQQQQQQTAGLGHQWPWNNNNNAKSTINPQTTTAKSVNHNNNTSAISNNNNTSTKQTNNTSNNSSSGKLKRFSTTSSDSNITAKKVRSSAGVGGVGVVTSTQQKADHQNSNNNNKATSTTKRLKSNSLSNVNVGATSSMNTASAEESQQSKITGYFKSQMKPVNGFKKELSTLVAATNAVLPKGGPASSSNQVLDKFLNVVSNGKVKDDELQPKPTTINVRTLTTMSPSLKKIERKNNGKISQVVPMPRSKVATLARPRSPRKHVAIAPRTLDLSKSDGKSLLEQANISQPTVLLTAIRIPTTNATNAGQQAQQKLSNAPVLSHQSTPTKMPSLFQIPVMPSLVQIPNMLATSRANLVMNNAAGLARMSNSAQYFLNGAAVIKLHQFTAANSVGQTTSSQLQNGLPLLTTTQAMPTSITAAAVSHNQGPGGIGLVPFQQTTSASQAPAATKPTSLPLQPLTQPTMQQLAAAAAANHQRLQAAHQLSLMTALPAVIATSAKLPQGMTSQAIPALQPIQPQSVNHQPMSSNVLPNISTILQNTTHHHSQQAQFILSQQSSMVPSSNIPVGTQSHPPPLTNLAIRHSAMPLPSLVSISNTSFSNVPPLTTMANNNFSLRDVPPLEIRDFRAELKEPKQQKLSLLDTSSTSALKTPEKKLSEVEIEKPVLLSPVSSMPTLTRLLSPKQDVEQSTTLLPTKGFNPEKVQQKTPPQVFNEDSQQDEEDVLPMKKPNSVEFISEESESSSSPAVAAVVADLINGSSLSAPTIDSNNSVDMPLIGAISPILSQPKTIRFPVLPGEARLRFGPKGLKRNDGVCYWEDCNQKYDNSSKLLDHMQTQHVNSQTGPFACLWAGCKVHGRESCSRRWLERHVLSHGGTKPFKCIVDGCGLRFGSQLALQKHVNGHFNGAESKDSSNKRTSDPPVPKLLRKTGKKLRYRRQPFSARMFDFFDSGVMEGLQHRLLVTGSLINGPDGSITFKGRSMARRTRPDGKVELLIRWNPSDIISDEWISEKEVSADSSSCPTKTVKIQSMDPEERTALHAFLSVANRQHDIESIFKKPTNLSLDASLFENSNVTCQDRYRNFANSFNSQSSWSTSSASSVASSSLSSSTSSIDRIGRKQSRKPAKRTATSQPS